MGNKDNEKKRGGEVCSVNSWGCDVIRGILLHQADKLVDEGLEGSRYHGVLCEHGLPMCADLVEEKIRTPGSSPVLGGEGHEP